MVAIALALAVVTTSCSGGSAAPRASPSTPGSPAGDLDKTVEINGVKIHAVCSGEGGAATVVLLPGFGEATSSMDSVRDSVDSFARVCTYDRPGIGLSDPPAHDQTFTTEARDLHALLPALGTEPPYVLVGHSLGGPLAVRYADLYGEQVGGVLLLDATPVGWLDAIREVPGGTEGGRQLHDDYRLLTHPAANVERLDSIRAFDEMAAVKTLGAAGLSVLVARRGREGLDLPQREIRRLDATWDEGQRAWASLALDSYLRHVDSGHFIQNDRLDLVVRQVRLLVLALEP
jgi:pimeloyl-ACP methyl ester carboxylesterase